jgi:hypothetical protein
MPVLCQAADWGIVDDTPFVLAAIREYNLRQLASTKPVENYGQLAGKPAIDGRSPESWVLMRAAELKLDAAG